MPAASNSRWTSLRKPLAVLAVPGMYLVYKYSEYRRQQQEQQRKKATEKELQSLNHKIDKLLNTLDEHESDTVFSEEDECVVCLCAKATMQTFPCGHKVVCRKCFVKTIQVAVTQRCLPLRCVVCRTRIYKLKQSRDVSPLTPPPTRRHLPWRRDNSNSPAAHPRRHHSKPCQTRSTSLARQIFRTGAASSGHHQNKRNSHQHHQSDPSRRASLRQQDKPAVATKVMQPFLIFPPKDGVTEELQTVTCLKKESDVTAVGNKRVKKQVRFASPVHCESPALSHAALQVDILSGANCDHVTGSSTHLLRNSADLMSKVNVMKYGECFSPRLARCCKPKSTHTSIFGSPRLVLKAIK